MNNCSSVDSLTEFILTQAAVEDKLTIILVGGCSRAGKTFLVSKLIQNLSVLEVNTSVLNLDSWLVSVYNRKQNSTVLERYEIAAIISAVKRIKQGLAVYPPVYDVASRSRVAASGPSAVLINKGILFIDGVVGLAIKELLAEASLRIYVDIADKRRKSRLVEFYSGIKKMKRKEYTGIIATREKEEVVFIKKTAVNADLIFRQK